MQNTGMALEDEVFQLVEKLINNKELPFHKDLCRFHRRKSYYSPVRNSNMDFENVLEVFSRDNISDPNAHPTIVVFFECKDHGRKIEVGRVDELIGRLDVPFGFAVKAYMVTRNGFSSGALHTARSKGIGLIKLMPDEKSYSLYTTSRSSL